MNSNGSIIDAREVVLGYGRLVVLHIERLALRAGDYVGIVGPNGAGKTTLLKALTGILPPLSGRVKVAPGASGAAPRFGYVAQSTTLDDGYPVSALDVVLMGRIFSVGPFRRYGARDVQAACNALERVGMSHRADWPFQELSRGQQQRILLARALAGDPDILCLDEPTNFLDPGSQAAFMQTLDDMRCTDGMTILVVTHLLQSVTEHADHVWLVQGGSLRVLSDRETIRHELLPALEGRGSLTRRES